MARAIGYRIDDKRLEIRGHALVLGVALFLASELMFFAAWFATYYDLRGHNAVWPPPGVHPDKVESGIGTLFLGLSSLLVWLAVRNIRKEQWMKARVWLSVAILCGVIFLAIAVHGWLKNHFGLGTNSYGSILYALTGFHALHVTAGVVALAYVLSGVNRSAFAGAKAAGADAVGYYWHFVFIVWLLGIWPTIYFVQ
ncbi:MAG: cytochrome c oxidase subunit 3 [Vulcanimicrobiaceae bacterium]